MVVVTVLIAIVAYVTTVSLYAADLSAAETRSVRLGDGGADLALVIKPRALEPDKQEFALQLEVDEGSALVGADGTGLVSEVRVQLRDGREGNTTKTISFGADSLSSAVVLNLLTPERRLETWPFDRYAADLIFSVEKEEADGGYMPLSVDLLVDGGVPGWEIVPEGDDGDSTSAVFDTSLTITRSFSTLAFGAVLVALMIVMATIALTVSINVVRGRRPLEMAFLSWIAGMLFAVPALRNFFPGQPPIGSWVDFLIVLWVIVALVVSLALLVISWLHDARPIRRSPAAQYTRT